MKSDSSGAVLAAAAACAVLAGSCVARAPRAPDAIAISVPWEIETLDPHASGTAGNLSLAANFYEPLVTSSPELRLAPALASAWENPDPLTWVFHLRPGARFHSGKAVGARDVVYSVERLRGDPELELAPYVRDVSDAEAVDERTVRLRTREPVTVLLNKLQYVFIVPEGSTEETLAESEDGSGPYRLVRWDPGSRIAMAAFDRPGTGRRQLGRVTFRLARGTDDAIEDLVSGRSQLVACNSRRLEDAAARLPGVAIERRDSLFVKYLAFDVSREAALFCPARTNPFRSAAVRHAVDLLIDRRRLAGTLAGTRAATQIVPPVVFGFDPELPPFPHDPDEARRLLRREGFPDGVRVALHTRRIFSETARLLKEMLADGGIDLEVVILSDAEYADAIRDRVPTFALDRFACQTGDASEIFDELVHSNDPVRRFGEFNFGGWSDSALDREIETSDVETGAVARNAMLRHVMDRVRAEDLVIPLDVEEDAYAVRREFAWEPREDGDIRAAEIRPVPVPAGPR